MSIRQDKRFRVVLVLAILICSLIFVIAQRNFKLGPDLLFDEDHKLKFTDNPSLDPNKQLENLQPDYVSGDLQQEEIPNGGVDSKNFPLDKSPGKDTEEDEDDSDGDTPDDNINGAKGDKGDEQSQTKPAGSEKDNDADLNNYNVDDEDDKDLGPEPPKKPHMQVLDFSVPPVQQNQMFGSAKYGIIGIPPYEAPVSEEDYLSRVPVTIQAKKYPKIKDDFSKIKIKPFDFRIYSHNIKNGGNPDLLPGEESWVKRLPKIVNSIKFSIRPNTLITLQEVYKFQMLDILDELNKHAPNNKPAWAYYGKGRIDAGDLGEMVPVIYKTSEWEIAFEDTVWLNEKDERMALEGWDARYLRILSYVTLKHKSTDNYLNMFNTHLDHIGPLSKVASMEKIIDKISNINHWPSFFCGDLNSEPEGQGYKYLTSHMADSARFITAENRYGYEKSTVTGFIDEILDAGGQNIDYIFAPPYTVNIGDKVECKKSSSKPEDRILMQLNFYGLLPSRFDGLYMSDHRPVVADFTWKLKC